MDGYVTNDKEDARHHQRLCLLIVELTKYNFTLESIQKINDYFEEVKKVIVKIEKELSDE